MATNPYVGPVPFSTDQKDFFFGRDEEAAVLLSLAITERIVLFYAQSGSGKSSLINARLIPDLENKGYRVLPVARVGGDLPSDVPDDKIDNIFVFNALLSLAETKKGFFGEKKDAKAQIGKSFVDYVNEQGLLEEKKQHWLIIDQFEEIITTHPTEDLKKRRDFFRQLKQMLKADEMLSLVLVMREDHLAGLDSFASLLPDRLSARYRIERLKRREAVKAVSLPALKGGREFEPGAAEDLVRDLSEERIADQEDRREGEYVEPLFLQLVCFSLWKSLDEVKSQKTLEADKIITKNDVSTYGDIDEALKKFYSDAVKRVAENTGSTEMAIRRWFGETLIAPTGIRAQVNRERFKSGGLSNKAVDQLVGTEHLIRLEEARGGKWYELAHDRFIKPIQDSNEVWLMGGGGDSRMARSARLWNKLNRDESLLYRGRLLQNAQARYERNKDAAGPLESEFLAASVAAEAKRTRQYGLMIGAMGVLLIVAIGFAVVAFVNGRAISAHARELEDKTRIAAEALDKEHEQRKRGDDALQAEQEQRKRADDQAAKVLSDESRLTEAMLKLRKQNQIEKSLRIEQQTQATRERALRNLYQRQAQEIRDRQLADEQRRFERINLLREHGCDSDGNCTTKYPVVGEVKWKSIDKGGFEFQGDWANERQIEKNVDIPQLKNISKPTGVNFDFFRVAVPQLKAAWAEIEKDGLLSNIKSWDGTTIYTRFSKRDYPDGHSLGIAFDINMSYYFNRESQSAPLGRLPQAVIAVFEKHGFRVSSAGPAAHVELFRLDKGT